MQFVLLFERYSQIQSLGKEYPVKKMVDKWGGLIGHSIQLKNDYLLTPVMGSIHVINTVYMLSERYNFMNYIRIGSCGICSNRIKLGETVIIEQCLNKDAVSARHLKTADCTASNYLMNLLSPLQYTPCSNYTIDVPWEKERLGADVVDMETSALYCIAKNKCLEAISISVARDNHHQRISSDELLQAVVKTTKNVISLLEMV